MLISGYRMGRQYIIDLLKSKPKKWFSAREIIIISGLSNATISHTLKNLRKWKETNIKIGFYNGRNRQFMYRYKEVEE